MARYREPEYCPQCGKQLESIHKNTIGFVGDTFMGYKPCDHKNKTPSSIEGQKEEWISIKENPPMKDGEDCLILFETGEIRRYMEDDLPSEIITHVARFPKLPIKIMSNPHQPGKESVDEIKSFLLAKAKELNIYVDFSDKSYDGDKSSPMDLMGFLDFICGQAYQNINSTISKEDEK